MGNIGRFGLVFLVDKALALMVCRIFKLGFDDLIRFLDIVFIVEGTVRHAVLARDSLRVVGGWNGDRGIV